jgi:hypothetical protein
MREPRAAAVRRTSMRPRLGSLLAPLVAVAALLATAGCGSSTSSTAAQDPGSSAPSSSGPSSPPGAKVHLISMTGAGGQPSGTAMPLNTPDQVAMFSEQFRVPALKNQIRAFTSHLGGDDDVQGAVVAVGCDRPPGAAVQVAGDGTVTIVPFDVASPLPECLAAVTTVAIATIPQG